VKTIPDHSKDDLLVRSRPHEYAESEETATFQDILGFLHRRRKLFFLLWLGITLLIATVGLLLPKKYESVALVVVAVQNATGNGSSDNMVSSLMALTQSRNTDTQVEVIGSPELIHQAYGLLTKKEQLEGFHPSDYDMQKGMPPEKAYKVSNKEDTDAVDISVDSYNPAIAAKFANAIADTYLERDLHQNNLSTSKARKYVERELERVQAKLAKRTSDLQKLKEQTGLITPAPGGPNPGQPGDPQVIAEETRLYALKSALDVAQAQALASQRKLAEFQRDVAGYNKSLPPDAVKPNIDFSKSIQENPNFVTELGRLDDLLAQKAKLIEEFAPTSIEVQQVDAQIVKQRAVLEKTAHDIPSQSTVEANPVRQTVLGLYATEFANQVALQATIVSTNKSLAQSQGALNKFPQLQRRLAEMQLNVDVLTDSYKNLYTNYNTLQVTEHSNLPNGVVASHATPDPKPYFPNVPILLILAVMAGLFASGIVSLALERLDNRVHDVALAEGLLNANMLSVVPRIGGKGADRPLIGNESRNSGLVEAFRTLRNNLYFASPDRPARILALTSAGPSEGKTTCTINLAIAMAMDGKKVLLIDGDLRRPASAKALGVPNEPGLTNVIAGQNSLSEVISATAFNNVFVLAGGPRPPNPTEILNSTKCEDLVREAAESFDFVLIDSPPAAGISDIQVISKYSDGVLIVVALEKTSKHALAITERTLYLARARVLGMIVNMVPVSKGGYYGYYGYNYYSYAYTDGYGDAASDNATTDKKDKKNRSWSKKK
jgi:capsular exopolysaccharide synthesis family protein